MYQSSNNTILATVRFEQNHPSNYSNIMNDKHGSDIFEPLNKIAYL